MEVFDEFVTGTNTTWYSPATLNETLGQADWLTVIGVVTNASGASASADVRIDTSSDGRNWVDVGGFTIASLTENAMGQGQFVQGLSYVRLRITLAGTSPACRLRIGATGRSYG